MGLRNRMRVQTASREVIDLFGKVNGAKGTKKWPSTNCWERVSFERKMVRAEVEKTEAEMEMAGKGWILDKQLREQL